MRLEHLLYTIPLRLRSIFRRAQIEQELEEELRFHLEQRIAQEIAAGKTPEEARYASLRAMDGMEQRKEECRDVLIAAGLTAALIPARRAMRVDPITVLRVD